MDTKKIAMLLKQVNSKYGDGTLYRMGDKAQDIKRVSTGLDGLDYALGGGVPEGRLIEMFGLFSSGKTSLAYQIMARYEAALFVDMEGTFDADRARLFGCDDGKVYVRRPQWGEQAFELMMDAAEAGMPFIVLDSVPCMIPHKEYDSDDFDKQAGVGMVANLMSRKLPKLCSVCEQSGTTVLFINQIRDKIGFVMYGDTTTTPGGHALRHLCSLRLQIGRKEWLEVSDEKLGQVVKVRVVKSKVCPPQRECELPMVFEAGFMSLDATKVAMRKIRAQRKKDGRGEDTGEG